MKKLNLKFVNAALSLVAMFIFLCQDIYLFVGTGANWLDGVKDFWPWLYVIIPVAAFLVNIINKSSKILSIIAACAMFVPTLIFFIGENNGHTDLCQEGFFNYFYVSIAMLIIACIEPTDESASSNPTTAADAKSEEEQKEDVRNNYSKQQLQDVVDNAIMYQSNLVEACNLELRIRNEATTFVEQVKAFDDAKIREILSNKATYSEALVYAVEQELEERQRAYREKEAQEIEAQRQRRAKEEEDERKRRIAWWKRWGWLVGAISAMVIAAIATLYLTSSGYYYSRGIKSLESGDTAAAIKYLSKIDDSTDPKYMGAKGVLFEIYSSLEDEKNASKMVNEIYNEVKMCILSSSVWDPDISKVAYRRCAESILLGKYIDSYSEISKIKIIDIKTALKLYKNLSDYTMCGVCLYHMGRYKEAYNYFIKEQSDEQLADIYLGIMYGDGEAVSCDSKQMYKKFDKVTFEARISGFLEKGEEWCRLKGFAGVWNIDILIRYLTGKGDLKLIYGDVNFESQLYGGDLQHVYNCYETAARLFPDDKRCTKRYQITKKVADLPIDTNKKRYTRDWLSDNNLWMYCGEYVDTGSRLWGEEITPHGYGIYSEFAPGGINIRTVVGRFVKLGRRSFSWSQNSLALWYDKSDRRYYVGYYEKGEYHPLVEY